MHREFSASENLHEIERGKGRECGVAVSTREDQNEEM
jgi:hypothetical protein